ncbi:MAG TPA: hypothetical protein VN788_08225 [Verrucomicrobiae bacterium]|nr:hypothetical protein [Verrucomicrobiae bacterium]
MMQLDELRKLSSTLLYEGCLLYPYRASALKNQRPGWTFGALLPRAYVAENPGESDLMQAQVLARTSGDAMLELEVRFLQLDADGPESGGVIERCVNVQAELKSLLLQNSQTSFEFPVPGFEGDRIQGSAEVGAEHTTGNIFRYTVRVRNMSGMPDGACASRDAALNYSLLSVNGLLTIHMGEFTSSLEPPDELREEAARCKQVGVYPVLAGDVQTRATMLISPIILYDFPQVAPESKGDFFDSSEIDEMLALRVLTLSDAEREEIVQRAPDSARQILNRTTNLSESEIRGMHGAFRAPKNNAVNEWSDEDMARLETICVSGVDLRKGDRVRVWPQNRADIFDIALQGKEATIEALEQTFEGEIYVAVTIDDDPGRDLGEMRQIGHRFFFRAEEIELLSPKVAGT